MKKIFITLAFVANVLHGAELKGELDAPVLAGGSGEIVLLSPKGEVEWRESGLGLVHDVWRLPNGNILFADGNVREVTPDHKTVFSWRPEIQEGGGAYSCQRLANGNTVIGENGSGRVVEVALDGKVVVAFKTDFGNTDAHHHLRYVRKTADGNYLVAHSQANVVREYSPEGKIIWELPAKGLAFGALRLPNGNTLVASLAQISEYTPEKKIVWEFRNTDIPNEKITHMCGVHVLPNGNLVIGCYSAYGKDGKGLGIFEITRDKKLVWAWSAPERGASLMPVQKIIPEAITVR